jgi:hypothetical protein
LIDKAILSQGLGPAFVWQGMARHDRLRHGMIWDGTGCNARFK